MSRLLALAAATAALLAAQAPWENPVRKLLRDGKPVIGGTITVASPDVAAVVSSMGFDFIWIEMEHSPITLETARNMVLATRGLKAMPFIRVPVNDLWTAKRALDAGALGVIFPFTSTPELARQAADATHYPPAGRRGAGPALAAFRWLGPESYYDFADRNVMCIVIVEEKRAVEQVEQIAATPGVDVIFIGTNDLAFSYGKRGNAADPEVRQAIERVVAAAKKNGKPVGRPAGTPEQIAQGLKDGFTFFQGPADLNLMRAGAQPLLNSLSKEGVNPKVQPLY